MADALLIKTLVVILASVSAISLVVVLARALHLALNRQSATQQIRE